MQKPLWEPSAERIKNANMTKFIDYVNKRYGLKVKKYSELHDWSINNLEDFWAAMWDFGEVIASKPYDAIKKCVLARTSSDNRELSDSVICRL